MITFESVYFTYQQVSNKRHKKNAPALPEVPADWGNSPDEYWALQDVSFTIEDGDFFGIAGHTGSGKSTLIQHTNGLLQPTAGHVFVDGVDVSQKSAATEARQKVGLVFQYPEHQLFAATVYDDVAFGPRNLGLDDDTVDARVREALELMALDYDELHDKSPFALSGGQQRRVAFAGVLAMNPTTLVLDEPTAGLDPEAHTNFLDLIVSLHRDQGLTVVVVSHNMDDLARMCNRVLILNRGRIAALGTPDEVFADEAALKDIGLGVPTACRMRNRLRSAGVLIGAQANGGALETLATQDSLADEIAVAWQAKNREVLT